MSVIRGNSCYSIADEPTWTEAAAKAVNQGGYLATINTKSEGSFDEKLFSDFFLNSQQTKSDDVISFRAVSSANQALAFDGINDSTLFMKDKRRWKVFMEQFPTP